MGKSKEQVREAIAAIHKNMDPKIHSGNPNIRFSKVSNYYHKVPELKIKGYRDCSARIKKMMIISLIKDKSVLDIGSNMGMMSIKCAKYAKQVVGVETSSGYVDIANLLKDYFEIKNVSFQNISYQDHAKTSKEKYDVILALAVKNWIGKNVESIFQSFLTILNKDGKIIFESHRASGKELIAKKLRKCGFDVSVLCEIDGRYVFKVGK